MKRKSEFKTIHRLISYYFNLPKGYHISHPNMKLFLSTNIFISRRSLKHIVEERKDDLYTVMQIQDMLTKIPEAVHTSDLIIPNKNKKHHTSFMTVKLYSAFNKGLVVAQSKNNSITNIITAFFRKRRHYRKIKAKSQ